MPAMGLTGIEAKGSGGSRSAGLQDGFAGAKLHRVPTECKFLWHEKIVLEFAGSQYVIISHKRRMV